MASLNLHTIQYDNRAGRFALLFDKIGREKVDVFRRRLKMLRQHRQHRHPDFKRHLHQAAYSRLCHKFMSIYAAVSDQSGTSHGVVSPRLRQLFSKQRHVTSAKDIENTNVMSDQGVGKPDQGLSDTVDMPVHVRQTDRGLFSFGR